MSSPEWTYELRISVRQISNKPEVIAWLHANSCGAFVEGTVDNLDIDYDYASADQMSGAFEEHGGDVAPLLLYRYDKSDLEKIKQELVDQFGDLLDCQLTSTKTSEWQEGWKESFKPILTERLCVYPPWEKPQNPELIPIEIEPGMAFGTGQHATTVLCLSVLERLDLSDMRFADVGSGSGILSVAAAKLGAKSIDAVDIDQDSVDATVANFRVNHVEGTANKGSADALSASSYDLVVANILAVVLRKIAPDLVRLPKTGGELLLSGILIEESEEVIDLYSNAGLSFKSLAELNGWVAIRMVRR